MVDRITWTTPVMHRYWLLPIGGSRFSQCIISFSIFLNLFHLDPLECMWTCKHTIENLAKRRCPMPTPETSMRVNPGTFVHKRVSTILDDLLWILEYLNILLVLDKCGTFRPICVYRWTRPTFVWRISFPQVMYIMIFRSVSASSDSERNNR